MNQLQKYISFFFIVLIGMFSVYGLSAKDTAAVFSSEGNHTSEEILHSPASNLVWASEEVLGIISLPKYSESQFPKVDFIHPASPEPCLLFTALENPAAGNPRDLRSAIGIHLFPFHFFL